MPVEACCGKEMMRRINILLGHIAVVVAPFKSITEISRHCPHPLDAAEKQLGSDFVVFFSPYPSLAGQKKIKDQPPKFVVKHEEITSCNCCFVTAQHTSHIQRYPTDPLSDKKTKHSFFLIQKFIYLIMPTPLL